MMMLKLWAVLVTRILGFLLLEDVVTSGAMFLSNESWPGRDILFFLMVIAAFFLALFLIVFPDKVVGMIMPVMPKERRSLTEQETDEKGADLLPLLLPLTASVMGVYFLFFALSDFAYNAVHWLATRSLNRVGYLTYWSPERLANFMMIAMNLLAGLYLLFGAKGLQKMWLLMRNIHPSRK